MRLWTAQNFYNGGCDQVEFEAKDYLEAHHKALQLFKIYLWENDNQEKNEFNHVHGLEAKIKILEKMCEGDKK